MKMKGMMMNLTVSSINDKFWFLLLASVIFTLLGNYAAKTWTYRPEVLWPLAITLIFYSLSSCFYFPLLLGNNMITMGIIWGLSTDIGSMLLLFLRFNEKISGLQVLALVVKFLLVVGLYMTRKS